MSEVSHHLPRSTATRLAALPRVLSRLFNVFPGEGRQAFLFALLAYLWSIGINLGLKYSDALLLIHVDVEKALPTIYVFSACGMIVPAVILLNVINKVKSYKIFLTVISCVIIFYTGIYISLINGWGTKSETFYYVLRIVSFQLDTIMITAYWTFIDQYHNMQDAKRLFILYSLTVFLGQATVGFVMFSGLFAFETVLFLIITAMIISAGLILYMVKTLHVAHDQSAFDREEQMSGFSFVDTVLGVMKHPFTLLMMLNNFVIFLMWVTTEYNYLSYFDSLYPTPEITPYDIEAKTAKITLFLGKLLATVSISNLIIGLFLYSRWVRRFGIGAMLMFSPTLIIFAMTGWLFIDSLLFPVIGYFVVEGSLEVVDDSNFNLLLNAVPKHLKYRVRIVIESFLEPLSMLASGLLLKVAFINTKALTLVVGLLAFILAILIRSKYRSAVYHNLAANIIHFERTLKGWFSRMTGKLRDTEENRLLRILEESNNPEGQIAAVEMLFKIDPHKFIHTIIDKIDYFNPDNKILFLDILADNPRALDRKIIEKLFSWLGTEKNIDVFAMIYFILSKQGQMHPENVINNLTNPNPKLRSAAILSLFKPWTHISPTAVADNRRLALEHIQHLLHSEAPEEVCMGLQVVGEESSPYHIALLLPFLKNPNKSISRQAMKSFSQIANSQCRKYAKTLISLLRASKDSTYRRSCLVAIGKLDDPTLIRDIVISSEHFFQSERRLVQSIIRKMGIRTIPILLALTKDITIPDRCRALAGKILSQLALPHLHANLHEIVNREIDRAYYYYYHYHSIQKQHSDIDLSLLVEALHTGYHSVLDFIIQILSAAGEVEDADMLSRLFRSPDSKIRSQVIETLEETCDRKIFIGLRPLMEDIHPSEVLEAYIKAKKNVLTLPELLDRMSHSPSQVDQIVSATLMQQLNMPNWKEHIRRQMKGSQEIFKHFANELLEA